MSEALRVRVIEGERIDVRNPEEARPPKFSDEALALQFAERSKDRFRFVASWSRWMHWDGKRWAEDHTKLAFDHVRRECREAAAAAAANGKSKKEKLLALIASARTVRAVESLATSDRRIAATPDQWDCDPWLLNTPDGMIDLRTGVLEKHVPGACLTKITTVAPSGKCPLFMKFLDRITGGAPDLQSFLARVFGYAASGSTKEHALFFCYGDGGNGKSVLLNTVSGVLGDYARSSPIECFTASSTDRHPTELARLRGARLVTATETERGRSWAEARIKALSAGDKIAARYMRQDFFEFVPTFKLIIAGNHKPGLQSVDEAIRRRFHLIPFNVTIPAEERDPDLPEKLEAEWPGILQWIIDGFADWQANGLRPPKIVTDATSEYLSEQDGMGAWLDERCMQHPDYADKSGTLFNSWRDWAEKAGETVGKQKSFSAELVKRGFRRKHAETGTIFEGIRLIPQMTADHR